MTEANSTIGVGVIGIGFGQAIHVPALRLDSRFEVRAICASTEERAAKVANKMKIPRAYGDWRRLVKDKDIHAVVIATPPTVQPDIAVEALEAGKHVFCEKPLAASAEAAERMVAAVSSTGQANMVDFEFVAIPEWRAAKKLLDEGRIGRLQHLQLSWHVETLAKSEDLYSWKNRSEAGGGTLFSFVSHSFHYLEWFAGPIRKLQGFIYKQSGDSQSGDTLVQLSLQFISGTAGSVAVSSNAPGGCGHRLELFGEKGAVYLHNPTKDYIDGFTVKLSTRDETERRIVDSDAKICERDRDGRVLAVGSMFERFGDWIEKGTHQKPDFEDGLRVQHLLTAAREADAAGTWIKL